MLRLFGYLGWYAGLGMLALILVGPVLGIAGALLPQGLNSFQLRARCSFGLISRIG